jgi:hypothetical protein
MSLGHGAKIVTDSLAFMFDMANKKSWKGKPTENILATSGLDNTREWSGSSYPFVSRNITSRVQALWSSTNNKISMQFEGYRDYVSGGSGGGNDGYPVMYVYFTDWSWSTTIRSYSYDWSFVKGDNRTMPNPAGKTVYFACYHMNSGNRGKSYGRNFQIEFSTFAAPFVDGTRSNTEAIKDLVGGNTVTNNYLSYNSDNTFKFDGSNDYVSLGVLNDLPVTSITCEAWIKPTRPSVGTGTVRGGVISANNTMYLGIFNSADGGNTFGMHWANDTTTGRPSNTNGSIPNNAWSHLIGTWDGSTSRAYLNGVEIWSAAQGGTIPSATYYIGTYGNALQDGVHNFNGFVGKANIYKRALSAQEIKQNFEAHRARYGI